MNGRSTTGHVDVIGEIWWPMGGTFAYSYSLDAYDVENMRADDGKIARREIQAWLDTHAGDFSSIADFSATIDGASYGWADADSELTFGDCMYGSEVS
jgi:hypothetical protein